MTYFDPMPAIGAIAAVIDDELGDRRDQFTLLAEPGRFLAADCTTLSTGVVGSAVRGGRTWHYLDDGDLRQLFRRDDRGRAPADTRRRRRGQSSDGRVHVGDMVALKRDPATKVVEV